MSDSSFKLKALTFKLSEVQYRHHQLGLDESIRSEKLNKLYERYNWLKKERLPDLDKELDQNETELLNLISSSVEQKLLAHDEVTDFEYRIWLGQKSSPYLSEIREAVFKAAEVEADQINSEWKLSLEEEVITLKKRKRDLEIEVDAVKDWAALQKKKFES